MITFMVAMFAFITDAGAACPAGSISAENSTLQDAQEELLWMVDDCHKKYCPYVKFNNTALTAMPSGMAWPAWLVVLDISNNRLTSLPDVEWPDSLKILDVGKNYLTSLPDVEWPDSLETLGLYDNCFTDFPDVEWPDSLVKLYLYDNGMTSLPHKKWPDSLGVLSLHDNDLTLLPNVEWPDSLVTLTLNINDLTSLPNVEWPNSLVTLFLGSNDLTSLPNVEWPGSLVTLTLHDNDLTSLPNVEWPDSLVTLFLGSNDLTSLPNVEWPDSLVTLSLFNNDLTSLPDEEWPDSLVTLSLFNNDLTSLPDEEWPDSLVTLTLHDNDLTLLPNVEWPDKLVTLDLFNNKLTSLPDVEWPGSLTGLTLYNNELTSLPHKKWPNLLKSLDLFNNELTSLPATEWPDALEVLAVRNNKLTSLPAEQWPDSLEILDLYNNDLMFLPDMEWPDSLKYLSLYNNRLTSLPPKKWPNSLEELSIAKNKLAFLPDVVWPDSLMLLDLFNNKLTSLPNVKWPDSLVKLKLYNNRMTSIPRFQLPDNVRHVDLSFNLFAFTSAATTFNVVFSGSKVSVLDLSNNLLTSLGPDIIWPKRLVNLDLSNNKLRALPATKPGVEWWPSGIQTLNLDGNTWEGIDIIGRVASGQENAGAIADTGTLVSAFHDSLRIPCGARDDSYYGAYTYDDDSQMTEFDAYYDFYINFDDTANSSVYDGPAMSISANNAQLNKCRTVEAARGSEPQPMCTVTCNLTESGATLVAAHHASVAVAVAKLNAEYVPVWAAGIPTAALATVGMKLTVNPSTNMEWFRVAVFFFAVVDLMTDWAFYAFDFASPAFKERYTCNASALVFAPAKACSIRDVGGGAAVASSFSCANDDYGLLLKSKCGNLGDVDVNANASNDCECQGFECGENDPEMMRHEDGTIGFSIGGPTVCKFPQLGSELLEIEPGQFGTDYAGPVKRFQNMAFSTTFSCTSYNGLDGQVNETCGTLAPATGGNECECHEGGECIDVEGTGGTCPRAGSAENDYASLKSTCLAFNIVATVVWIVQWASFAMHARAQSRGSRAAATKGMQTMRSINTATMVVTTLLEDVPQMVFLSTFAVYMDLFSKESAAFLAPSTKRLVTLSFVMSAFSMLATICEVVWRLFIKPARSTAMRQATKEEDVGKGIAVPSAAVYNATCTADASNEVNIPTKYRHSNSPSGDNGGAATPPKERCPKCKSRIQFCMCNVTQEEKFRALTLTATGHDAPLIAHSTVPTIDVAMPGRRQVVADMSVGLEEFHGPNTSAGGTHL